MGCGSSKDAADRRAPSRRYLSYAGGADDAGAGVYLPDTGPLTAREYKERLVTSGGTQVVELPGSGYAIRYAFVSQRGYYPDAPDKANQDAFCAHACFGGDPDQHLFGVFDGHGEFGAPAAQFARDRVPGNLLASGHFAGNPALAMHNAMVATNMQCHQADFDDSMSGTTAICLLVRGRSLLVANVGDSRAVLAERVPGAPGRFEARDLSLDQTPYRYVAFGGVQGVVGGWVVVVVVEWWCSVCSVCRVVCSVQCTVLLVKKHGRQNSHLTTPHQSKRQPRRVRARQGRRRARADARPGRGPQGPDRGLLDDRGGGRRRPAAPVVRQRDVPRHRVHALDRRRGCEAVVFGSGWKRRWRGGWSGGG